MFGTTDFHYVQMLFGERSAVLEFAAVLDGVTVGINDGDRIAQAMVVPYPRVEFVEADDLTDTKRGAGGFGSTGQ